MSAVQRPKGTTVRTQFESYLKNKTDLVSLDQLRPFVFQVDMQRGGVHIATLVDYYLLSDSDVLEIRASDPEADAIVNAPNWNAYKPAARALANSQGVGLFDWKEFMRAVHYNGATFLDGGPVQGTR